MRFDTDWSPRVFFAQAEDSTDVSTDDYQSKEAEDSITAFNAANEPKKESTSSSDKKKKKKSSEQTSRPGTVTEPTAAPAAPAMSEEQLKQAKAAGVASSAAMGAGTQSTGYARASGLSPAQAALMAGQQAGSSYNTAYGQAYQGQTAADIAAAQLKAQVDATKFQQQQQTTGNWMNLLGAGLTAGAFLLSDENAKTDIKDGYGILERVTSVVGPKSYKYKGDSVTRQGVMAQDLEKSPLAHTVAQDEDGTKMVDTAQLTTANTGMITELSRKVDDLARFFKGGK